MNQLSEFVKNKRKQLGLTQEEFSEKAGVVLPCCQNTIGAISIHPIIRMD
jgi:transcriptional regulator with XRE-family HTH domain